jgi:hypothetical protein
MLKMILIYIMIIKLIIIQIKKNLIKIGLLESKIKLENQLFHQLR